MNKKRIIVLILFIFFPFIVNAESKVIYLTFDDGPSRNTSYILDVLKSENVKATFFITGKGSDYIIKREYEEGHSIGLHTYSHNYKAIYSKVDVYFQDIEAVNQRLCDITTTRSKIVRFAGGSSNTISRRYKKGIMSELIKEVIARGYKYYDWNIDSGDASGVYNCNIIYNNVVKNLKSNRVNMVLMHDSKKCTLKVLKKVIDYGKSNGYKFKKITYETEMITQKVNN